MPMKALSEVAKDAMELPSAQRFTLARMLLDESAEDLAVSPDAEAEWETEICRRMQSVQAGTAVSRSFDEVFAILDRHREQ